MAKLYCDIETNRMASRGSDVHRLGDEWVEAGVQNWEFGCRVWLSANGQLQVQVRRLHSREDKFLYNGPIAEVLEPPKVVAVSQPTETTALEVDVQQFLKESA